MTLTEIVNLTQNQVVKGQYDTIIVASGYESRASNVAEKLYNSPTKRKIALGFRDRLTDVRKKNDKTFRRLGYKIRVVDGNELETISPILQCENSNGLVRSVLIDISSMTRVWYGGVIRYLRDRISNSESIQITFTYSPSNFTDPQPPRPHQHVDPIPGFTSMLPPDFPTALFLGLGYESERALAVVDYLEPTETFAFITDPAIDQQFTQSVLKNNSSLLRRLPETHLIRYPLKEPAYAFHLLRNMWDSIGSGYRKIIAPLGPKPFALAAFLIGAMDVKANVWRISPGTSGYTYDRKAIGSIVALRATFESNK